METWKNIEKKQKNISIKTIDFKDTYNKFSFTFSWKSCELENPSLLKFSVENVHYHSFKIYKNFKQVTSKLLMPVEEDHMYCIFHETLCMYCGDSYPFKNSN